MHRFLAARFFHSATVIVGVAILTFFLVRLTGDPTVLLLPQEASQQDRQRFRLQMGFDKPLPLQFVDYMRRVVKGDFGFSYTFQEPTTRLVLERLPATFELVGTALAVAMVVGVPLGMLAAGHHQSGWDTVSRGIALIALGAPGYWLGIMSILLFAVKWRLVPTSGRSDFRSLIFPALTLAMPLTGRLIRLTRSCILELLREDYVRTAYAKGLNALLVYRRHLLRNALIPIVTLVGVYASYMVGGSVLIETVFSWPGIGLLSAQAILKRDFPLVQAVAFYASVFVVLISFAIDILYSVADPRVREG